MSVSKYKPIRRVAIGGMAEVLLASQQSLAGFERLVVIKRILPHLRDDQEFVQMFLDEARLAATLQHPSIVETLDVYRQDETFNVAMEYISGEDLRYVIGRARKREIQIPVEVACRIITDIASALDYVHAATDADGRPLKIVHRDVAPSNIILGYSGLAKLIDFGIAKAQISHIYTRPGTLKGKFAYMSPEQIQHKELDGRSDVFSLSIVLYELLTATRLFKGPSQAAVLQSVMERPFTPPSEMVPKVPKALDKIVLAGLVRDRDKRIHAGAMHDLLEKLLGSEVPVAGHKQVSTWMKEALKDRWEHRVVLERAVVAAAREPVQLPEDQLPPMFTGVSYTGKSQAPSGAASGSGTSEPSGRSNLLLVMGGALGALILVGAVLLGFVLGTGPAPTTSVEAGTPLAATLVVDVSPSGAELFVDGRRQPELVGSRGMEVAVKGGARVKLLVKKAGYRPYEEGIEAPRQGQYHVHVKLEAQRRVAAKEPAVKEPADVKVDVEEPSKAQRRPHRGKRPWTAPWTAPRTVPRPAPNAVVEEKPATGTLTLTFRPRGATVLVDGIQQNGRSPLQLEGLRPGSHTVVVEESNYHTVNRAVMVTAGHTARVEIQLVRQAPERGVVDIISVPSGATVQVNGKPMSRAPVLGLKVDPDVTLEIKITHPGYKPWSTRLSPSSGRNPTVVATLQPERVNKQQVVRLIVPRSQMGSASRGKALVRGRCTSCHKVASKKYTSAQWSRYFANGRHDSSSPLAGKFTRSELSDVKAFLMSVAADIEGSTAAGVR